MKKNLSAVIFSVSIIVAALILGGAFINRNAANETISVTGLCRNNFTSDLIVWEGRFTKHNSDLKKAYSGLNEDKKIIQNYLLSKGISEEEIVFSAVSTEKNTTANYSDDGKYMGQKFTGYKLTQRVEIQSKNV